MTGQIEDIDRIMAVMAVAFPPEYGEAWTRRQLTDALAFGNCHYILIDENGAAAEDAPAAGFALSRAGYEEEELLLFAVAPACRRRGLGRAMLHALAAGAKLRGAQRLLLEMRRGNEAESLYRDFGFTPIGIRPDYYRTLDGHRIDAITFARPL